MHSHLEVPYHLHQDNEALLNYPTCWHSMNLPENSRAFVRINQTGSESFRPHELRPQRFDQRDESALST